MHLRIKIYKIFFAETHFDNGSHLSGEGHFSHLPVRGDVITYRTITTHGPLNQNSHSLGDAILGLFTVCVSINSSRPPLNLGHGGVTGSGEQKVKRRHGARVLMGQWTSEPGELGLGDGMMLQLLLNC